MRLLNIMLQAPPPPEPQAGIGQYSFVIILFIMVIFLYFFLTSKEKNQRNDENTNEIKEEEFINECNNAKNTSPFCKSQKTKKKHECEWCGNKIY
jgi:Ca2+/Na+ antiporter